jgi:cyclic-di-GMP-binding protein
MPTTPSTSATFLRDHGLLDADVGAALEALRGDALFARGLRQLAALQGRGSDTGAQTLPQRVAAVQTHLAEAIALWPALLRRMHTGGSAHSDEARWAAQLARYVFMATHGRAVAAADAAAAVRVLFLRPRPRLDALAIALDSAWRMACVHAHLYTALPAGFWADCHRLHALAQAQGLEHTSTGPARPTLGTMYRRVLLIGMTGINRYEPARMDMVLQHIAEAAPRLGLQAAPGNAATADAPAFYYRRGSDRPPIYNEISGEDQANTQDLIRVDVQRMAQELDRRIFQLQRVAVTSVQQLQLLMRLHREWVRPPQRRHLHRRWKRNGSESVQLTSGMLGCWQVIDRSVNDGASRSSADATMPQKAPVAETAPPPAQLSVCNISPSGMQIMGDPGVHALAAGELVAYRHGSKPWRLGLVRWVRMRPDSRDVECGIEVIGIGADTIMVAPVMSRTSSGVQPALRLGARNVIVVAGRYFHPYREFLIYAGQSKTLVRAVRLLLESARYQVIECQLSSAQTPS